MRAFASHWWQQRIGPRGRHLLHGGAWSLVSKACSAANLLLSVPLVLASLGAAHFGVWATIVSLVSFAGFLDFGFGNGAMNLVAGARGRGAEHEVASIVQAARRPLLVVSACVAVVGGFAVASLPLGDWLRIPSLDRSAARACFAFLVATVAVGIPLNFSTRVMLGLGEAATAFRWQAAAQLVTLASLALAAVLQQGLVVLVGIALAVPLLGPLATTVLLRRHLHAQRLVRSRGLGDRIRREGALFFALQLAAAASFGLDLALITHLQGPESAAEFTIVQRAFSLIPLSLGLLWTPLWPTYRHALAAGHWEWVIRTLRRSLAGAVAFAALGAALVAAALALVWPYAKARAFDLDPRLVGGFALWVTADAAGSAISTFFNAASIMRYQVVIGLAFAVVCVAVKAWSIGQWGAWSAPWTTLACYLVVSLLPTAVLGPRLVQRALASRNY